jgi:hypothetical protein
MSILIRFASSLYELWLSTVVAIQSNEKYVEGVAV